MKKLLWLKVMILIGLGFKTVIATSAEQVSVLPIIKVLAQKSKQVYAYYAKYKIETLTPMREKVVFKGENAYQKGTGVKIKILPPGKTEFEELLLANLNLFYFRNIGEEKWRIVNLQKISSSKFNFVINPLQNALLTRPFLFKDVQNYKPIKWEIQKMKDSWYYVFTLKWQGSQDFPQTPQRPFTPSYAKIWINAKNGILYKLTVFNNKDIIFDMEIETLLINEKAPKLVLSFPSGKDCINETSNMINLVKQFEKKLGEGAYLVKVAEIYRQI